MLLDGAASPALPRLLPFEDYPETDWKHLCLHLVIQPISNLVKGHYLYFVKRLQRKPFTKYALGLIHGLDLTPLSHQESICFCSLLCLVFENDLCGIPYAVSTLSELW